MTDAGLSAGNAKEFLPRDAWNELVHKDDRTSLEEYPDMSLISFAELKDYMERHTHPAPQAAAAAGKRGMIRDHKLAQVKGWIDDPSDARAVECAKGVTDAIVLLELHGIIDWVTEPQAVPIPLDTEAELLHSIELMMGQCEQLRGEYQRGLDDAIKAIRAGRDDWSSGEDIGKTINWILGVAEGRIADLSRTTPPLSRPKSGEG